MSGELLTGKPIPKRFPHGTKAKAVGVEAARCNDQTQRIVFFAFSSFSLLSMLGPKRPAAI
jgi:hypothetical protein